MFCMLYACDSQKQTIASRGMQNLTAHYNILYNAKELVAESERNIQLASIDHFDRLITVYKEPAEITAQAEIKNLDEAILKANTITNEKSQSKYVDDAYFLIGKANHLKANFYNASEFFTYVYNTYPEEKELRQAALAWKARSLIESERFEEAESTLDTAFKYIGIEKESVADIYATRAELHLYAGEDAPAISMLEQAIKHSKNRQNKIRWIYLMAQLQQLNGNLSAAYANYTTIVKSNAPFEMAFNAGLNRIVITNELSGNKNNEADQLYALLKDDKNRDFVDQIYYRVGNSFMAGEDIGKAIDNYKKSVATSTKNPIQKGLSYLKLAEIYLNQSDFVRSKAYYDSTLAALPVTFSDYDLIKKKSVNLDYLASRLQVIAREDTLQMLAALPEEERLTRIDVLAHGQALKSANNASARGNLSIAPFSSSQTLSGGIGNRAFYFYNSASVNQGIADFKKRWGNRKLEDNWRRSEKSASEITNSSYPDTITTNTSFQTPSVDQLTANTEALRQDFVENIPLEAEQKMASDQRIASALYDIANYYRDITLDTADAIHTYEKLLSRFPENQDKLAVYYNLYLLYGQNDPQESEKYRNILLSEYPLSPFAKTILDPNYNEKQDEEEQAFHKFYNDVYDRYVDKKYDDVVSRIEAYIKGHPGQALSPQLDYLKALAIGRTNKLPALEKAFRDLVTSHPDDKLIVPLVKLHLAFIDSNRTVMSERPVALMNNEQYGSSFVEEPTNQTAGISTVDEDARSRSKEGTVASSETNADSLASADAANEGAFFSKDEEAIYYFVVNVSDPRVNLSSSRFGIGQYNRINLPGEGIRHQLKRIDNQNQLIYIGPFKNKEAVLKYDIAISPMMKEIMKIPAAKYTTFYINQQSLEKIVDKEALDRYIDFYRSNY